MRALLKQQKPAPAHKKLNNYLAHFLKPMEEENKNGYGIAFDDRGTIYIGYASRVQKEIDEVMVGWENQIVVLEIVAWDKEKNEPRYRKRTMGAIVAPLIHWEKFENLEKFLQKYNEHKPDFVRVLKQASLQGL